MHLFRCFGCGKHQDVVSPTEQNNTKMETNEQNRSIISKQKYKSCLPSTHNTSKSQIDFTLQYDQQWVKDCKKIKKKQFEDNIFFKLSRSDNQIISIICSWGNKVIKNIQQKHYQININFFSILQPLSKQAKYKLKSIQVQQIFYQPSKINKETVKQLIENIKYVITQQYAFHRSRKAQSLLKESIQRLDQIQNSFHKIMESQNSQFITQQKGHIISMLQNLLANVMINQFLEAVKYILFTLKQKSQNQFFTQLQIQWCHQSTKVKDKTCLQNMIKKIKNFKIQNAKQIQEKQRSNPFQKQEKPKEQSSPSNSSQQDFPSQQFNKNKQSNQHKIQQAKVNQKTIKYYTSEIKTTNEFAIITTYVSYIPFNQNKRQYSMYHLKSLLKQNQFNVYRYLENVKKENNCQFKIIFDHHPQNSRLIKNQPISKIKCFQIRSLKGDKQYSKLYNRQQNRNILKQDIWNFKSRQLIYSFLKSFANGIRQLQSHGLHQTDFQLQNFIKFKNIFQIIDYGAVFLVFANQRSQDYFSFNFKIFKCWLNSSSQIQQLRKLTATQSSYEIIKDNQDTEIRKAYQCMAIMQTHMKINHYNQFQRICKSIVSKEGLGYQGFPLNQMEVSQILAIIPNNRYNLNFNYQEFIYNLEQIYQRHNSSCSRLNLIGKQYSLASSYLSGLKPFLQDDFKEKIVKTIRLMQYRQFTNVCYYYQQQTMLSNDVLYSQDNNYPITLSTLYSKERYIVLFLKSCIELIEELQFRGFVMLNFNQNVFAQYGEKFILKNLAFIFKVRKDFHVVNSNESSYQKLDASLIDSSIKAFTKIILKNEEILPSSLSQEIWQVLFNNSDEQNIHNNAKILNLLRSNMKEIHFIQFMNMVNSILALAPQTYSIIGKIRVLLGSRNTIDYLDIYGQLQQIVNQSY